MSARRVAVFVLTLAGGGGERTNVMLANWFAKRGLLVDLVVVDASGPFRKAVADDVRLVVLEARHWTFILFHFCRYLTREKPDAVLATMRAGTVALLADRLVKKRWRTVIRCEASHSAEYRIASVFARWLLRLQAWLLPSADAVVTVCKEAADDIGNTCPKANVHAIYNGHFDSSVLQLADEPIDHPWFNTGEPPVIVSVGRLVPQKDYQTLLHAFAAVVRERPARLVIVGEGQERSQLLATAHELGIARWVDLVGFQGNPFPFIKRARVFVLSSIAEGMPAVLIEALACGTSVVSTACPTGPREALEEGKFGRLVPVGDSDAMAAAVLKTLGEPFDSNTLVARAKLFDPESCVEQHLALMFPAGGVEPPVDAS